MDKTFFVVVPYDPVYLPKAAKGMLGFLKKGKTTASENQAAQTENSQQNLQQLNQRADQTITGLQQIGLRAIPLGTEESIELIYNLYNPQLIEKQNLAIAEENS